MEVTPGRLARLLGLQPVWRHPSASLIQQRAYMPPRSSWHIDPFLLFRRISSGCSPRIPSDSIAGPFKGKKVKG